jgi:hypothetical protein
MATEAQEYGQMNFDLPHDVVGLPSQGWFYKGKKSSIKVGYLTAADENIIMAGGTDMVLNLLRNKIYEPGMKVEELLEGDIEAILIFLRNTAFGPEVELKLTDPKTQKQFTTNIRLDELTIINGEQPGEDGFFETMLPISGANVKLKSLTYGEVNEIQKQVDTYPQGRVAPRRTWRLQKEIVAVDGNTDKGMISRFIETMMIADSKHIKKFMDKNEPRLDMSRIIMTPSGERLTVNVGFGVEFFRPFF